MRRPGTCYKGADVKHKIGNLIWKRKFHELPFRKRLRVVIFFVQTNCMPESPNSNIPLYLALEAKQKQRRLQWSSGLRPEASSPV
jgi:hypothetical protein